jgi:hypothetical protein
MILKDTGSEQEQITRATIGNGSIIVGETSNPGTKIIEAKNIGDPKYGGQYDKMQYTHRNPDGSNIPYITWKMLELAHKLIINMLIQNKSFCND